MKSRFAPLSVAALVFAAATAAPAFHPAKAQDQGTADAANTAASPASPDAAAAMRTAQALAPAIEDVQVVGPWSDGSKQGVWRTVMVRSEPAGGSEAGSGSGSAAGSDKYRFFVQRLAGSGPKASLVSTKEITEINTIEGTIVGYRADDPSPDSPDSLTLFFDIVPPDAEVAETYQLNFFGDAPYEFGPATN